MEAFLANMDYWHWLVFGLALVIIELFAWSTFFLWIGISAMMVGIVSKILPDLSWQLELLLFSALSIISIFLARKYFPVKTIDNELNSRATRHIGNSYTVVSNDENGAKIKVGDSLWLAKGCDMHVGQKVKVIDTDSVTLIVEPDTQA
ncbi:MAG: NfeD family protein [Gammaproteobacteria bacterium]|nr:NfeD family protein [Gammaproteobacteria bacterium]